MGLPRLVSLSASIPILFVYLHSDKKQRKSSETCLGARHPPTADDCFEFKHKSSEIQRDEISLQGQLLLNELGFDTIVVNEEMAPSA